MAENVNLDAMKEFLECTVCLHIFQNPKQLRCHHQFCQHCLEDLILFQPDGSGRIICPLRCEIDTIISPNETVNNLPVCYEFKGLLNVLGKGKPEGRDPFDVSNCAIPECRNPGSIYCCGEIMCRSCYVSHEDRIDIFHENKINLQFSKLENKFKILCDVHSTTCSHLCADNQFLCTYCLHRDGKHKSHLKSRVIHEVESVKVSLEEEKDFYETKSKFMSCTQKSIKSAKNKLSDILKARKNACISNYRDFLNREEQGLLKRFEDMCDCHMKQYTDNLDIIRDIEHTLKKNDVILAIEKDPILKKLKNLREKEIFSSHSVNLSNGFDFSSATPLGSFECFNIDDVQLDKPTSTLHDNFDLCGVNDDESDFDYETISELENLVKEYGEKVSALTEENMMFKQMTEVRSLNFSIDNKYTTHVTKAFFDVSIGSAPIGRIVIDLYKDDVPLTCENFAQLCSHSKGFGYRGSKFHSVIKGQGFCAGGDFIQGDGRGGRSIYGAGFKCENFKVSHNMNGIITMQRSLSGFTDSVFYITCKPRPDWNGKHVAFGKVTANTYHVLQSLMNAATNSNSRPLCNLYIVNCGVF